MRTAEWISLAFFSVFVVAAWVSIEDRGRRRRATAIGSGGAVVAAALHLLPPAGPLEMVRDLIPGAFLLVAYWQTGQFFRGGDPKLQAWLQRMDERWLPGVTRIAASLHRRPGLSILLEVSYLMCYPVVPLAIGALYLTGHRGAVDWFWTVVLPPTLACYALIAFFQSLPPRLVETNAGDPAPPSPVRSANLWLLRRASIRANTLPSGHVANSVAITLALLSLAPAVGIVFLGIALGIAVSTVVLRYHYGVDAVLGVAFALGSFLLLG